MIGRASCDFIMIDWKDNTIMLSQRLMFFPLSNIQTQRGISPYIYGGTPLMTHYTQNKNKWRLHLTHSQFLNILKTKAKNGGVKQLYKYNVSVKQMKNQKSTAINACLLLGDCPLHLVTVLAFCCFKILVVLYLSSWKQHNKQKHHISTQNFTLHMCI